MDRHTVVEAEVAIMLAMWGCFFFPAAVLVFEYAWDTLTSFASTMDARRPKFQRALLRLSARYKPIQRHRIPYWIRRKLQLQRLIAALRWQRGGCRTDQYAPPQIPKFLRPSITIILHATMHLWGPSQVIAILLSLFRLYLYIQEWLS